MAYLRGTDVGVGNAVSEGLGFGLGLVIVPYMFQGMTSSARTIKAVIVCQSCGGKNAENFKFCGHCGHALYPLRRVRCPKCGTIVPIMKFCGRCGAKINE